MVGLAEAIDDRLQLGHGVVVERRAHHVMR
jgi:hypothetical protein